MPDQFLGVLKTALEMYNEHSDDPIHIEIEEHRLGGIVAQVVVNEVEEGRYLVTSTILQDKVAEKRDPPEMLERGTWA